jgi:hypothetical protein
LGVSVLVAQSSRVRRADRSSLGGYVLLGTSKNPIGRKSEGRGCEK